MGKDIILSACKQRELENIIFRLQKNVSQYSTFGDMLSSVEGTFGSSRRADPRPETAEPVGLIVKGESGCPSPIRYRYGKRMHRHLSG